MISFITANKAKYLTRKEALAIALIGITLLSINFIKLIQGFSELNEEMAFSEITILRDSTVPRLIIVLCFFLLISVLSVCSRSCKGLLISAMSQIIVLATYVKWYIHSNQIVELVKEHSLNLHPEAVPNTTLGLINAQWCHITTFFAVIALLLWSLRILFIRKITWTR